jgi:hypothetical protein
MTKEEIIARLKMLREMEEELWNISADGVIPATKRDMEDELGKMDGFREDSRDQKKGLTSDEK